MKLSVKAGEDRQPLKKVGDERFSLLTSRINLLTNVLIYVGKVITIIL